MAISDIKQEALESEVPLNTGVDGELPSGYIVDFVSGKAVRGTPEELFATQTFARRLVEDFDYPKNRLITRPQYKVRMRPSDSKHSYPVDIAVFSTVAKHDADLLMVVECKAPNVKVGRKQLEIYLSMSDAQIGVWFNGAATEGASHLYLRKDYLPGGLVNFSEIPTLPRFGQRLEDVGLYLRRDLKVTEQLKTVLRDIRNHLAGGNHLNIVRDEPLAQQIINVLFCKVFDETSKGEDELMEFRAGIGEHASAVRERVLDLFARVKTRFSDVFDPSDSIVLDDESIAYVVGDLQTYSVTDARRDVVGDAFEVFMGPALRGEEGQFFTPRNVVHMMVEILDPGTSESIIDPACGSRGFLITALDHVWKKVDAAGQKKKWNRQRIVEEQKHVASQYFRGIEKDSFLAKVTKAYMAILGDGRGGVFCDNSLLPPHRWSPLLQAKIQLGTFDVVMTNPPFGTKIPIKGQEVLGQYTLGHQNKLNKQTGRYE